MFTIFIGLREFPGPINNKYVNSIVFKPNINAIVNWYGHYDESVIQARM